MIYQCDQCKAPLPACAVICPKCGERFLEMVPADAEVPKRGFTAVEPALSDPPPAAPQSPQISDFPEALRFQFVPAQPSKLTEPPSAPVVVPSKPVMVPSVRPAEPFEEMPFEKMSFEPTPFEPESSEPEPSEPEPSEAFTQSLPDDSAAEVLPTPSPVPPKTFRMHPVLPVRRVAVMVGVIALISVATLIHSTVRGALPGAALPGAALPVATAAIPVPANANTVSANTVSASTAPLPPAAPPDLTTTGSAVMGLTPLSSHPQIRRRLHHKSLVQGRVSALSDVPVEPRAMAFRLETMGRQREAPLSGRDDSPDPAVRRQHYPAPLRQPAVPRRQHGPKPMPLRARKMLYSQYWRAWDLAQKRTSADYLLSSPHSMAAYDVHERQMERKSLAIFRRKYHLSVAQQDLLREQGLNSGWPHP